MSHEYQKIKLFAAPLLLPVILMISGCAGRPPTDKITAAEQSLNQANMNEGDKYAPLEMRIAQDKLAQAKKLMMEEEYEDAAKLADEALVNAKLASAKADTARSTLQLENLQKSIDSLRNELKLETQ